MSRDVGRATRVGVVRDAGKEKVVRHPSSRGSEGHGRHGLADYDQISQVPARFSLTAHR